MKRYILLAILILVVLTFISCKAKDKNEQWGYEIEDNDTSQEYNEDYESSGPIYDKACELAENMKKEAESAGTLEEYVAIFEKMSRTYMDEVISEDQLLMFENGYFDFTGEDMFYFTMTRQLEADNDDEFYQIHMDIMLNPADVPKLKYTDFDSEDIDEFIEYVRKSKAYEILSDVQISNVDIYVDET